LSERGHDAIALDPAEVDLESYDWHAVDACFIALHGPGGEDGRVQQVLERLRMPYTGSGPAACRLAMSKSASKERFLQVGVPTPEYVLFHQADRADDIASKAAGLGYPLFLKPDSQGSSVGVSLVQGPDELPAALAACFEVQPFGLLERRIVGRELTATILDSQVLPLLEIISARTFFDYEAKYHDAQTRYTFELGLPEVLEREIGKTARAAAEVLGTRGLCRVDLMLDDACRPWVLEVNTVPGLTDHSLAPMAARRAGISFGELCERLVRECLARSKPVVHAA